jgi:NADPH:quinone reductase-like Zn-dependent oxidoreductase
VVESVEAVEEEVERERELGFVIARSEGAAVGDREGHLDDIGMGRTELPLEFGGRRRIKVPGIVEEPLREPEQEAAEDVRGVMHLRDGEAAFAKDADHRVDVSEGRPAVNRENLAALRRLLESGEVRVVIAETYPLDQAATAVTHMLEHHPGGKIAITV